MNEPQGITITFLGCGKFGTAILKGILSSAKSTQHSKRDESAAQLAGRSAPTDHVGARRHLSAVTTIIACVKTHESARRLWQDIGPGAEGVSVLAGENARAVQLADVVLLGCRPRDLRSCLGDGQVCAAMQGKVLVSVLAGATIPRLRQVLREGLERQMGDTDASSKIPIVRAIANLAAMERESVTVATAEEPLPPPLVKSTVQWIFERVGSVVWTDPADFDTSVTLCSSGPAFLVTYLESLIDGAVFSGLERKKATEMAALMAKGTASLLLGGQTTSSIRESVTTPGGSTAAGLLAMEEDKVRAMGVHTIQRAAEKLSRSL